MTDEEKPGDDALPDNNRVEIEFDDEALRLLVSGLLSGLQRAASQFIEGKDAGRRGAAEALNAVMEFLSSVDGANSCRWPFAGLGTALESLEDGNVLPLLRPRPRSGGLPASTIMHGAKALAVMTVVQLCETGLDRREAFEKVAKVCREVGVKPGRKGAKDSQGQAPEITERTVRGWYEKIAEDVGRRSQAAQFFSGPRKSRTPITQAIAQTVTRSATIRIVHAIERVDRDATRGALLDHLRRALIEMLAPEH
jgi:hypothetical protein